MLCQLPQGVLKSVVASAGVHKVFARQLFDVMQTLELWRVHDPYHQGVELYVSVYRVIKYLHIRMYAHTYMIHSPTINDS